MLMPLSRAWLNWSGSTACMASTVPVCQIISAGLVCGERPASVLTISAAVRFGSDVGRDLTVTPGSCSRQRRLQARRIGALAPSGPGRVDEPAPTTSTSSFFAAIAPRTCGSAKIAARPDVARPGIRPACSAAAVHRPAASNASSNAQSASHAVAPRVARLGRRRPRSRTPSLDPLIPRKQRGRCQP